MESCLSCGTSLIIQQRYRIIKPLRPPNRHHPNEIFEVEDRGVKKVMKVLTDDRPQMVEMFEREALTLQILNHPGIPKIDLDGYFSVEVGDRLLRCLVMEKIEGENLEDWLQHNPPISQRQGINWLRQLIEILDVIHRQHFFHRDIKPSNIVLKPNGQLVLIDFGAARGITNTFLAKLNLKNATTVISGGYTPPEQVEGRGIPQSDFFALGRTFVHLLTGKSPLELPKDVKTGRLIWRKDAKQISPVLADFIDELMAVFPGDRPQNTEVILRDLTPNGLRKRRVRRFFNSPGFKWGIRGVLALIVVGIGVYLLSKPYRAEYTSSRGREALIDGNFSAARTSFEQAIKLNPKSAKYYNDLALTCKQEKDVICALDNYRKAAEIEPENATFYYNLANLYEDIQELNLAAENYQKAIAIGGRVEVDATNNLARLLIWQNLEYRRAENLLLGALNETESASVKAAILKNLGWANLEIARLQVSDRYQQDYLQIAENYLQESINLKGDRATPHCLLAQVLEEKQRTGIALESWQKCRDLDIKNLPEEFVWQRQARQRLANKICPVSSPCFLEENNGEIQNID
jgi:serine/threonine protein kinase